MLLVYLPTRSTPCFTLARPSSPALAVGILITGCQSNETSADACPSGNPDKAHGALSNAIQTVVKQHHAQNPGQPLTYR